jgi:hypothetical protein
MGKTRRPYRGPWLSGVDVALWLAVVVVAAILFVDERIRNSDMRGLIYTAGRQTVSLRDERAQLTGLIVNRQKPGAIEQIARSRLGMDYASGRQGQPAHGAPRGGRPQ